MRWIALLLFLSLTGCVQPPKSEADVFDDVVQLTSGFKAAGEAFFSSDTNWIVFQAIPPAEDHYQMYLARLLRKDNRITGIGQAIRITPPDSQSSRGYFSPDGVSIILASSIGKERDTKSTWPTTTEIYRADAWQGAIAATEFSRGINLAQHALTRNHAYDGECAISPNGQWIIFTSTRDADPSRPVKTARDADLYVMRSDGTRTVRLTTSDGYDGSAIFSPDGGRIVFRADRGNRGILQLHTADLAWNAAGDITGLQREQPITRNPIAHFSPNWHPSGGHIIYAATTEDAATDAPRDYELFMMRTDGTHNLRITFTPGADLLPAFSADGKYLMWTTKRSSDKTSQIYIAKFKMPAAG